LATHEEPAINSLKLQDSISNITNGKEMENHSKSKDSKGEQHYQWKVNYDYTKQCSGPSGLNGIRLCGTASNSNIEMLQRFRSKTLRSVLNTPWYVNNSRIHEDLQTNTVESGTRKWSEKYLKKLENYSNA
jgi:hypothetical protein